MRIFAAILLTSLFCVAQSITLGVIGGGRLTGNVDSYNTDESKRYIVGPSLEVGLPLGFQIEADGLYQRSGYQISLSGGSAPDQLNYTYSREHDNIWEVPLVLKYTIPTPGLKPFVLAGGARRTISGAYNYYNSSTSPVPPGRYVSAGSASTSYPASSGIVAGMGLRVSFGRLLLAPQARFTHWSAEYYGVAARNEVDLLVNICWKLR